MEINLSIIIPCYNEELVIAETHKRLSTVLNATNLSYELIYINDGSRDNTINILKSFSIDNQKVKVIDFSRNFGHQNAVTAGLNNCLGEMAVIIDADLQDPPEIIPEMVNKMKGTNANVVYGVRKSREGENWFKLFTAKLFYRMLNALSDYKFPLDTGDFRLIDRKVINEFNKLPEKNKYIRGLISWMGFKQEPIHYDREARFAGETKYPLKKMIKFALTGLFYFSKRPLQIANIMGTISICIGILYALIILFQKIFMADQLVLGWSSIIFVIIFFGGVQLLTIGILGKYVGNLFDEAKSRPEYIINEKINF